MDTKKCKYCKTEIDKKAKICPNCKKKQSGKALPVIIAVIVILIIVGAINGGKDNPDTSTPVSSHPDNKATEKSSPTEKTKPTEKPIEYTKYKVSELMDDLNTNAMKAEKKYTDQYVEITGKLFNIDSDGKYIDLGPSKDDYTIIGVQCYIQSDDQTNKIIEMKKGQEVTLKGKITQVGEVLGYSLDIDDIE
jgi:hypothetical protein